jgi:hypothetical protein
MSCRRSRGRNSTPQFDEEDGLGIAFPPGYRGILAKSFGETRAVCGVDLAVQSGTVYGFRKLRT